MAVDRLYVEWLDASLGFFRHANYVGTPAGVAAYLTALQAASNAGQVLAVEGATTFINNAGVGAQFPATLDLANLVFTTGVSQVHLSIPAPVAALFTASLEVVDPTDPTGVIAAAIAALGDTLGNPVTAFVQGVRSQRRRDEPS